MKKGICTNTDEHCSKAMSGEIIELEVHADFECPECGKPLEKIKEPKPLPKIPWGKILIVLVPLLLIGGGAWWWINKPKKTEPIDSTRIDSTKTPPPMGSSISDTLSTSLLKQNIRDALENSRFEEADSLITLLLNETLNANKPRASLSKFYAEIKEKADFHFVNIVVNDKDCNRVDIPFRYYICAMRLSSNDKEMEIVRDKRKACESFSKTNCKAVGVTVSSGR